MSIDFNTLDYATQALIHQAAATERDAAWEKCQACIAKPKFIDVVFDGPPSHESGRFIEVEKPSGQSVKCGEWIQRGEYWVLRISDADIREQGEELTA